MHLFKKKITIDVNSIELAISELERNTRAEIRVYIDRNFKFKKHSIDQDAYQHAKNLFEELGITETAEQNGILIYLNLVSNKVAIIADKGINDKIEYGFWEFVNKVIIEHCQKQQHSLAVILAIELITEQLKIHYPVIASNENINELANEVIIHD